MTSPTGDVTRRGPSPVRAALALVVAMVVALVLAAPAAAHTTLESSDPAEGAVVTASPSTITLTFAEVVSNTAPEVTLTGPDGTATPAESVTVIGDEVTAAITPPSASGGYLIDYRVAALDGDDVRGSVRFTLELPASPPSTTTSTDVSVSTITATAVTTDVVTSEVPTTAEVTTTEAASAPSTTPSSVTTDTAGPTSAASSTDAAQPVGNATESGTPAWVWWVIVLVVLAIGSGVAVYLRRRRTG